MIRYLKHVGFGSYFATHNKAAHSNKNRKIRLRRTKDQWSSVVWLDESFYTVKFYGGGANVLCRVEERYYLQLIVPMTKWGKRSVIIWSCFWAGGSEPLIFTDGNNADQDAYVYILSQRFLPWFVSLNKYDKVFIFQEDGATCHTGGYATWWKTSHSIRCFDYWCAQSPDLNPIVHIWSCLDKLIDNKRASISNTDELKTA